MQRIIWLTGNSGAGKSTVAFGVQKILQAQGTANVIVLDGDEMRATISTHEDLSERGRRSHNIRIARLAQLLQGQQMLVIVSLIAPYESLRQEITALCDPVWVYVKRKSLESPDKPYEPPIQPELTLDHNQLTSDQSIQMLLEHFGI